MKSGRNLGRFKNALSKPTTVRFRGFLSPARILFVHARGRTFVSVAHSYQCNADVTSSVKNADYSQVSAMGWREKMTAVLFTSGQEFSREERGTDIKKPEAGSGWHV